VSAGALERAGGQLTGTDPRRIAAGPERNLGPWQSARTDHADDRVTAMMRCLRLATGIGALVSLATLILALGGCGKSAPRSTSSLGSSAGAGAPAPAFGLTEDNASLLWNTSGARASAALVSTPQAQQASAAVARAREQITALHPDYARVLIDWAALQPRAGQPPALEARVNGCARSFAPCAPYTGVRAQLAAIASQQRASGGAFQVVVDIFGTPAWAARKPSGCESGAHGGFSRAPSEAGIDAYKALIHSLITLAAREGVGLQWWAPWNEPNAPAFISPQRASCAAGATALSPSAYSELVRAMATQLRAEGGDRHLLLGELAAYQSSAADRVSLAEFVRALPEDVACTSGNWSIHAYANRGAFTPARDPVAALQAALQARGGCALAARIWVTEAGAGAPHAGLPRPAGSADQRAGCLALARQLEGWQRNPRVAAVFQYSFREDPAFPVGLSDPALAHTYPAYRLWLSWARRQVSQGSPSALAGACE
jgi:hypothetical protein